jgi:hypothetical protein
VSSVCVCVCRRERLLGREEMQAASLSQFSRDGYMGLHIASWRRILLILSAYFTKWSKGWVTSNGGQTSTFCVA